MLKKVLLTFFLLLLYLAYRVYFSTIQDVENTGRSHEVSDAVLQTESDSVSMDVTNGSNKEVKNSYPFKTSELLPKTHQGVLIEHNSYALSYVEKYEQAEWVAHQLTPDYIQGKAKRKNNFKSDQSIVSQSASHKDFTNSGFDRGHLLPAADRKSKQKDMNETFFMSNVAPQNQCLNRQGWRLLEESIRKKVIESDSLFIITGTIVTDDSLRLGANEVVVPQYFYKIILDYDYSKYCSRTYLVPNTCVQELHEGYVISIDSLEKMSGIDFFEALQQSG